MKQNLKFYSVELQPTHIPYIKGNLNNSLLGRENGVGVKIQTELARDIGMLSKSTVNASNCEIINNIFSPYKSTIGTSYFSC